jgi:hypothetical protein
MQQPKFKKGDKIKPLKKNSSNYYKLKDLMELEVIDNNLYPTWNKKLIEVKIIKGSTYNTENWSNKYFGDRIRLYENAFELLIPEEDNYEIY